MFRRNEKLRFLGVLRDRVFVGPEKVVMHITDRCNFKCLYCYYHTEYRQNRKPKPDMDFDFFKKIIDDCHELGVKIITLSGSGEPSLHPKIWDMIEYIKSKGMILSLVTNGSFDKNFLKHIMKLDFLVVSLSAVDEKRHRELQCNIPGTFEKIFQNLFYLSKIKQKKNLQNPFIQINYIMNEKNYKDIRKIFQFAEKINLSRINFKIMRPTGLNDKIALSFKAIKELKRIVEKLKKQGYLSKIANNLDEAYGLASDPIFQKTGYVYWNSTKVCRPPRCYSGWYYASIDINGDVIYCCQIPWAIIGNVYEEPLKKIWKSKKSHRFRLEGKYRLYRNKYKECNFCYSTDMNRKIFEKLKKVSK